MRVENRKALLVGVDTYASGISNLNCCVNDATRLGRLLERHDKGDPNFSCRYLLSNQGVVKKTALEQALDQLFKGDPSMVLFYFSGHGSMDEKDGYMICQDTERGDLSTALSMSLLLEKANQSGTPEVIIILDCCHAGAIGHFSLEVNMTMQVREGITILASTLSSELAVERMGHGVFTNILCQGLEGTAADILGHVTAASLYNLADSILSPWEQRPVFQSYVHRMRPLKYCFPKVPKKALRRIIKHFPSVNTCIGLSDEFLEYSRNEAPSKVGLFKELVAYESVGLVKGRQAHTLFQEAEINGECLLSEYGKLFWKTVNKGLV